jgi:predicted nucleic acid-binding protein
VILIDSSVWIDHFNGDETIKTHVLEELLIGGEATLAVADLVLFEVLRGYQNERDAKRATHVMTALPIIGVSSPSLAISAVRRFRSLRARGFTINSAVDLLQANFCIENNHTLLHDDQDFDHMETYLGLRVWRGLARN